MPNRIIKESIWTSPNLNRVSMQAEWLFYRLIPAPDDNGCFEATPLVVKGKVFPLREEISVLDLEKWYGELEQADLIRFWSVDGRQYGFFTQWDKHQRIRSVHQRKTPVPPENVSCRQLSSDDRSNLNLNLNLNLNKNTCSSDDELFDVFWKAYPKKKAKSSAKRAWSKIKNRKKTLDLILKALAWQVTSDQWARDAGQFIPHPATYLNAGRWEDEPDGNGKTDDDRKHDNLFLRTLREEDERTTSRRMDKRTEKIPTGVDRKSGSESDGGV